MHDTPNTSTNLSNPEMTFWVSQPSTPRCIKTHKRSCRFMTWTLSLQDWISQYFNRTSLGIYGRIQNPLYSCLSQNKLTHRDWRNKSPSTNSDQYDHSVSRFFLPFFDIDLLGSTISSFSFSFWLGEHPIYIDRTCLILATLSQRNPGFETVADVFGKRRYPLLCAGETTSRIKARCHGKQRCMKGWQWKHAAS